MPPSSTKESVLAEIQERMPARSEDEGNGPIRFDLCMASYLPIESPRELWLDHAILHETSNSYQDGVIAYLEGHDDLGKSPAFKRTEDTKRRRYTSLISITKHLTKQKTLDFQPFFLFPVLSSLGYLNHDGFQMVKWISTLKNGALQFDGPRSDGVSLGTIKARFRVQIRNALCFGLLRASALAMHSMGRPEIARPI